MKVVNWFLERLQEKSTWAGTGVFAGLFIAFGIDVESEQWQHIGTAVSSISAVIAIMMKENK